LREDDDELPPPPNTRHTNCLAFSNTPDVLDKTLRKMKSFYFEFLKRKTNFYDIRCGGNGNIWFWSFWIFRNFDNFFYMKILSIFIE
jgi:hypothetical protein